MIYIYSTEEWEDFEKGFFDVVIDASNSSDKFEFIEKIATGILPTFKTRSHDLDILNDVVCDFFLKFRHEEKSVCIKLGNLPEIDPQTFGHVVDIFGQFPTSLMRHISWEMRQSGEDFTSQKLDEMISDSESKSVYFFVDGGTIPQHHS